MKNTLTIFFLAALLITANAQQQDTCVDVTGDHSFTLKPGGVPNLRLDLLNLKPDDRVKVTIEVIPAKEAFRFGMIGRPALAFTLGTLAGTARGTRETLINNYPGFKSRFPGANDQFWNPSESWRNKWKNGDPDQGEAFPLSSTAGARFTDAYHALPVAEGILYTGGAFVVFNPWAKKQKWWKYVIDFAALNAGFWLGSNVSYEAMNRR